MTSRRLRRVTRTWYAIARAGFAHPERRRAHDVAVAAHRRGSTLKSAAKAFAAFRVAVVASAVTAVAADATRVKCAAVVGWRARRVRREVFWALARAAALSARFRGALAAVARDLAISSGRGALTLSVHCDRAPVPVVRAYAPPAAVVAFAEDEAAAAAAEPPVALATAVES